MTRAYIWRDNYPHFHNVLQFSTNEPYFFVLGIPQLEDRMATRISTGYGLRTVKLFFDSNKSKYELWKVKFLGYLRIQHLHQIVLSLTDQSDDMHFVEKKLYCLHQTQSIFG